MTSFDEEKKIEIYEDDFCIPEMSNMENETRERNLLSNKMGKGGWHIQLDTDEYFLNFREFVYFLKDIMPLQVFYNEPVCVCTQLVTLFKKTKNGFLFIKSKETAPVATRYPYYTKARAIGQNILITNFEILHQSWARDEEEIKEKLDNWGHKKDFNTKSYFNFWNVCDEHNYQYYNNFNPVDKKLWKQLYRGEALSIPDFILTYKNNSCTVDYKYKYHPLYPKKNNFLNRLKAYFK